MPRREYPAGLDIGARAVKVVVLQEAAGTISRVRCGVRELPAALSWQEAPDHGLLAEAITGALDDARARQPRVVVALPRHLVTAKVVSLPRAEPDQMRKMIGFEAQQHVPFPLEEVVLDFQALPSTDPTSTMVDVMLVAAQRSLVQRYLDLLAHLRLELEALTVDSLSLYDLTRAVDTPDAGATLAINIGAKTTVINIADSGGLRLTRAMTTGGDDLTRAIAADAATDLQVPQASLDAAPRRKRELGLAGELGPATRGWLEALRAEVHRSEISHAETSAPIARAYVSGGEAATPGLVQRIADMTGFPTEVLSVRLAFPQAEVRGLPAGEEGRFAVAAGLALRGARRSATTVNLVPGEGEKRRERLRRRVLGLTAVGLLGLLVIFSVWAWATRRSSRSEYERLRGPALAAATRVKQVQQLRETSQQLSATVKELEPVFAHRQVFLDLMKALSERSPEGVTLTRLMLQPDRTAVVAGRAPSHETVAVLESALRKSELVSDVVMTRSSLAGGASQAEFELTVQLKVSSLPTGERGARQTATRVPR